MGDEWTRPRPPTDVIEVPLVGDADERRSEEDAGQPVPPEPNWRRIVGLSLIGGALLGIGVAVVITRIDDPSPPSTSTLPPEEIATSITTPPTLSPLEELPPPGDPAVEAADDSPQPPTSQDRAPFQPVPVPTYPTYPALPDTPLSDIVRYSLATAIGIHAEDSARRSTTHMELGVGGFALDVVIVRDPVRDRYQLTIETQAFTQTAVVDPATNSTYVESSDGEIVVVLNEDIMAGTDAETINEYFDRLLQGPVRPGTLDQTSARGRGLVTIDEVGLARQFVVDVAGELIPEWQLYVFGPTSEFSLADRPDSLEYFVYVTEGGTIAQVDGVSYLGDVAQLIRHRIEILDEPIIVELPVFRTTTSAPTAPTTVAG